MYLAASHIDHHYIKIKAVKSVAIYKEKINKERKVNYDPF